MLRPRTVLLSAAAAAAVPSFLYARSQLLYLESTYPSLPVEQTSTVEFRRTAIKGSRKGHTPHVDVYAARVPLAGLISLRNDDRNNRSSTSGPTSLEEAWARAFMGSRLMVLEGRLFNRFRSTSGDTGQDGFWPGQSLLSGAFTVIRPPSRSTPLLVEWPMPPDAVLSFEKLAAWGYPFRLVEGGRHEFSVGASPEGGDAASATVEVRFSAAHDYAVVEGERGEGKVMPKWVLRLHRAYARLLLDRAAQEVRARAEAGTRNGA
jgi:hypothetical protein